MIEVFVLILVIFLNLSLFIVLTYNFLSVIKVKETKYVSNKFLSILIPVRNEEKNIYELLENLKNQTHKNYEVIVYNDESTDRTYELLERFKSENPNFSLKILVGKSLPESWTGKNFACHNLSLEAKGDYLVFIDADVRLKDNALSSVLELAEKFNADFVTVFPNQIMKTFGEKILVDLVINLVHFTLFPMKLSFYLKNTFLTPAIGQFLFVNKDKYFEAGGHESIKSEIVDDRNLAINFKKKYFSVLPVFGDEEIFCRMYEDFNTAFSGFTKNFYLGSMMNKIAFVLFIFIYPLIFILPFIMVFWDLNFLIPIWLIISLLIAKSLLFKQNIIENILFYPIQVLIMPILGIRSLIATDKGIEWKGRTV